MAPTNPTLFARPADVFDLLGVDATMLRLDDKLRATGQRLMVTADAAVGAVSLPVTALARPLLRGTVLAFEGGGMAEVVEVTLSAAAAAGDTALAVAGLTAAVSAQSEAYDSGVNVALAGLLVKACQYGTGRVKLYCSHHYNDSEIAKSINANRWATAMAAQWVCKRLSRACPQGLKEDVEESIDEMRGVMVGSIKLDNAGSRSAGWPFITNVTVDTTFDTAKVRVEPTISEGTPTLYPQYVDWNSVFQVFEW